LGRKTRGRSHRVIPLGPEPTTASWEENRSVVPDSQDDARVSDLNGWGLPSSSGFNGNPSRSASSRVSFSPLSQRSHVLRSGRASPFLSAGPRSRGL
jgi:hypothetical protein